MSVRKTDYTPTIEYPERDGKPMAETDIHRNLMLDLIHTLRNYFRNEPDVYVSGNLLLYYVEGNPTKRVAPDVFVVRGVDKADRRIYALWKEGQTPEVIIEISSRATWKEDLQTKWRLYAELGVQEYFIFDPEYDYLDEPLVGYRLRDGNYVELEVKKGRVRSKVLGLDLVDTGKTLRLFDPKAKQVLMTPQEVEDAHRIETETLRQTQEEVTRLRKELEKMRKRK